MNDKKLYLGGAAVVVFSLFVKYFFRMPDTDSSNSNKKILFLNNFPYSFCPTRHELPIINGIRLRR